jgi:ankyrin repeat protein
MKRIILTLIILAISTGAFAMDRAEEVREARAATYLKRDFFKASTIDGITDALKEGAEIDSQDKRGRTMLIKWATGNADIVNYLLEERSDVDMQDNQGNTALMIATKRNNVAIVKLLLEYEADQDIENDAGETALGLAEKYGLIEVINCLSAIPQ